MADKAPEKPKTTKKPDDKRQGNPNPQALKEAREREAKKDMFTYLGKVLDGAKKLPPQAQAIVNILQAAGDKGLTRQALTEEMNGVVVSRQSLGRILSYYQKQLVDEGYVTFRKSEPREKPAKKYPEGPAKKYPEV